MLEYPNFTIDTKEYENRSPKDNEKNFDVFSTSDENFTFGATKERYEVKRTNFKEGFYVRKSD